MTTGNRESGIGNQRKWKLSIGFILLSLCASHFPIPDSRCFAAFDESLPGARPSAMAGAFAALADDANVIFTNPAALGWIEHQEFTSGYSRLYMGLWDDSNLGTNYLALTQPISRRRRHQGAFAAGWMTFGLSQFYMEETWLLGYGRELLASKLPGLYAGATLKRLRHVFLLGADPTAAANPFFSEHGTEQIAWGFDGGLLYRRPSWSLAYALANANEPLIGLAEDERLKQRQQFAMGYHRVHGNLTLEATMEGNNQSLAAGAERWVSQGAVALRSGLMVGNHDLKNASFGFGLRSASFTLDYALRLPLAGISLSVMTHRASFSAPFGSRLKKSLVEPDSEMLSPEETAALRESLLNAREQLRQRRLRILELERSLRVLQAKPSPEPLTQSQPMEDDEVRALQDALGLLEVELSNAQTQAQEDRQRLMELERKLEENRPRAASVKPKASNQQQTHRVEASDTLESLAQLYYGERKLWIKIFRANESRLKRGGELPVGAILIIPALETR